MESFITKSKYFNENFNTAIFSDPIRIYFSQEHESHALEIYSHMQSRKNQWEKFLNKKAGGKYCYIMLYADGRHFNECFQGDESPYAPGSFGDDFVMGVNGPLSSDSLTQFLKTLDSAVSES